MARQDNKHLEKKRHGLHHKRSKRFEKVYWPYVPILLVIVSGLVMNFYGLRISGKVLSYATNISVGGLLEATNNKRGENSQKPLKLDKQLSAAAQAKANDMVKRDYWSHVTPDGEQPWVFIDQAGYRYIKAGENLAYGFLDSRTTVEGWMNSTSHRLNMLDEVYEHVGFGFANSPNYSGNGPETIVVAMYGQSLAAGSTPTVPEPKPPQPDQSTSILPISSDKNIIEPASRQVALAESFGILQAPWMVFAVGLLTGAAMVGLLLRHGLRLRHLIRSSERFFLHHPYVDLSLLAVIIWGLALTQTIGIIK